MTSKNVIGVTRVDTRHILGLFRRLSSSSRELDMKIGLHIHDIKLLRHHDVLMCKPGSEQLSYELTSYSIS